MALSKKRKSPLLSERAGSILRRSSGLGMGAVMRGNGMSRIYHQTDAETSMDCGPTLVGYTRSPSESQRPLSVPDAVRRRMWWSWLPF